MKRRNRLVVLLGMVVLSAVPGPGSSEQATPQPAEPGGLAALTALGASGSWSEAHLVLGNEKTVVRRVFAGGDLSFEGLGQALEDGIYHYDVEFVSSQADRDLAALAQLRRARDLEAYRILSELIQSTDYSVRRSGRVRVSGGLVEDYGREIEREQTDTKPPVTHAEDR